MYQKTRANLKKYRPSNAIAGIILMLVNAIAMSGIYIISKRLIKIIPPEQLTFLYKTAVLLAVLPWCSKKQGLINNLKTQKLHLHIIRGAFSAIGSIFFYYSLKTLKTTDAAAIAYLENAIVLFIGIFYFKESVTRGKIVMIIMGVFGLFLVMKPGFQDFNSGYTFLFLALISWAINNLSIKLLGKTERSKTQVFYASFFGSIFSVLIMLTQSGWSSFQVYYLKYIAVLGVLYFLHTYAFFKAFKFADISLVMPYDYTRLIFTGIFAAILLSETPDLISIIGYFLIAIGGIYLILEEGKKKGWHQEVKQQLTSDVAP